MDKPKNMNRLCFFSFFLLSTYILQAQNKKDIQGIQALCGCFEVTFMYAETFSADTAYKFDKRYHASGLEYVVAEEAAPARFVLQHLLIADDNVIKHWREDWTYQETRQLHFVSAAQWKPVQLKPAQVTGQWTQSVWEVDDAPRYMGTASWIHANGKSYWENITDAPLPRREYSKRSDYNVMRRGNRVSITDSGWVHEQDNGKIIRKENTTDKLLAQEKGFNIYKKVEDARCTLAKDWWAKNKTYWNVVRKSWSNVLKDKELVTLQPKVNDRMLFQYLFDAQNEFTHQTVKADELPGKVTSIINRFVK
jgi:hypothetical protein